LLPATSGFARKAKPFCQFYERECAAYAILNGIQYIYRECPYAEGSKQLRNKSLLNQMEDQQTGFKTQFYLGYLRALERAFSHSHKKMPRYWRKSAAIAADNPPKALAYAPSAAW
jgi:tRNA(Ile)-lysidine synthase TilS/MesJ